MSQKWHFGLLGHKIGYSQSPDIFRVIGKLTDSKIEFDLFDIGPLDLPIFMEHLLTYDLQGLSVTIPHKAMVMQYLAKCDETARDLGAVNSISLKDGEISGHNTDWQGIADSLNPYTKQITNGRVLVIGTGGVARAVVYAVCRMMKPKEMQIVGRSEEQLGQLKQTCERFSLHCRAVPRDTFEPGKDKFHLVVNCTPLGGWHYPNVSPLPGKLEWRQVGIYFDVNYNAENIPVDAARKHKIPTLDGRRMLVAQAVRSFEIWTGQTVDIDQVRKSVFKGD